MEDALLGAVFVACRGFREMEMEHKHTFPFKGTLLRRFDVLGGRFVW